MSLFQKIRESGERLDRLGQEYLDRFEFLDNLTVCLRIAQACERWRGFPVEVLPWFMESVLWDDWMPYCHTPHNGSLHFSLGYSVVSRDAHLRNLLEIVEGRETRELDFPVIEKLEDIACR